jgi:hypothetical protein
VVVLDRAHGRQGHLKTMALANPPATQATDVVISAGRELAPDEISVTPC